MSTPIRKEYSEPLLSEREILRYAGIPVKEKESSEITELLLSSLSEVRHLISYRVCYLELPVEKRDDLLDLGFALTASKTLGAVLAGCERVILVAASVGMALDRMIARYSSLLPSRAHMIAAIGAERIEALLDAFCSEMDAEIRENGYTLTKRVSAGYGDIPLEMQRDIFRVLDLERQIGVSLTKSLMMVPSKSVTAIIGVKKI